MIAELENNIIWIIELIIKNFKNLNYKWLKKAPQP